jgi:hypothetical protein
MGGHYEGWKVIGYWGMCGGRVDGINGCHERNCSWRTGLKTGAGGYVDEGVGVQVGVELS